MNYSLEQYFTRVVKRVNHHAFNVDKIIYQLYDLMPMFNNIRVKQYLNKPKNVIWFEMCNNKFVFTYDHTAKQILLRDKNLRGDILCRIDNNTDISTIKQILNIK